MKNIAPKAKVDVMCKDCRKNKAEFEFGGRNFCRKCYEKIGEGMDNLEIRMIVRNRGKRWIKKILKEI